MVRRAIWVVRGVPGVGKSSLGRRIRRVMPNAAIIEVDKIRSMVSSSKWTDQKSHVLGLRQSASLAESFLHEGYYPVILIDTLAPSALCYLTQDLKLQPIIITLIARNDILLERVRQRQDGFKDEKIILQMNEELFRSERIEEEVVVDTSEYTADEVASKVLDIMRSRLSISMEQEIIKQRNKFPEDSELGDLERGSSLSNSRAEGTILLIRHAHPTFRSGNDYQVPPGSPLSPRGVEQARELAYSLKRLEVVKCFHSPFERARKTAQIIFGEKCPLEEDSAWSEIRSNERFREVLERVRNWLKLNIPIDGTTVAVVGHGASIKAAVEIVSPKSISEKDKDGNIIPQAGIWILSWKKGRLLSSRRYLI